MGEIELNRTTRIMVMLMTGIMASGLVSWSIFSYVLQPAQARVEAFAAIRKGELTAGADGVVKLPDKWAMGSVDGKAYLTRTSERSIWVLFVTEAGSGSRLSGHLFCDRPGKAGPKMTIDVKYPSNSVEVTVRVIRATSAFSYEVVNDK